jgi:hypothetical protein
LLLLSKEQQTCLFLEVVARLLKSCVYAVATAAAAATGSFT